MLQSEYFLPSIVQLSVEIIELVELDVVEALDDKLFNTDELDTVEGDGGLGLELEGVLLPPPPPPQALKLIQMKTAQNSWGNNFIGYSNFIII